MTQANYALRLQASIKAEVQEAVRFAEQSPDVVGRAADRAAARAR